MKFEPFDIGRFLIVPGKRFHLALIKAKVRAGVMEKVASITRKYGVKIVYLSYSMQREYGKPITAIAFLDMTDSTITAEELAKEVRSLDVVEEVREVKPEIEGFICDMLSFPLVIGKDRVIILREQGIKGIICGLRKRLGSAAEAIQYFSGFEAGLEYGKSHIKLGKALGIKKASEIFSKISAPLFTPIGFGLMEVVKITDEPPYALIRVYRCFECECCDEKTERPYSHLVRGMSAGLFTSLFKTEMFARETKCIAKGDPYCEFKITPQKDRKSKIM